MRLTEAQSRELLRTHGVYVTEACGRCGKILGPVRFTRKRRLIGSERFLMRLRLGLHTILQPPSRDSHHMAV